MKTVNYLLGGKPHSIDDCLDLCRAEKPERVTLEVGCENKFLDFDLFRRLFLRSTWYLPRGNFSCVTTLGGYLLSETRQKKQTAIEKANKRLQSQLTKIQETGINPQSMGLIAIDALEEVEIDV